MIYCISDIHGCNNEFKRLLRKIHFKSTDDLYILGDVIDRGEKGIECLKYIMRHKNIHMLMGNHEHMMLHHLSRLNTHVSDDEKKEIKKWISRNGATKTYEAFFSCSKSTQDEILNYLKSLPYYHTINVNRKKFLLVHAGIRVTDKDPVGRIPKQSKEDLVWIREEFIYHPAIPGITVVFGHTPVEYIDGSCAERNAIWYDNKHSDKIGIDGGCVFGGLLFALCLDNMREYYVEKGE
jgi:serine/threonine protein phosphatase 1